MLQKCTLHLHVYCHREKKKQHIKHSTVVSVDLDSVPPEGSSEIQKSATAEFQTDQCYYLTVTGISLAQLYRAERKQTDFCDSFPRICWMSLKCHCVQTHSINHIHKTHYQSIKSIVVFHHCFPITWFIVLNLRNWLKFLKVLQEIHFKFVLCFWNIHVLAWNKGKGHTQNPRQYTEVQSEAWLP